MRTRAKLVCALGFAAALVGSPRAAHAQSNAGLELEWQAPVGCPDRAALLVELAQVLGRPLRPDDPTLRARGRVARTPRGDAWRLELQTSAPGGTGQRTLADPSCAHLTSAAALVLALTIDDAARAAASAPAPLGPPPALPFLPANVPVDESETAPPLGPPSAPTPAPRRPLLRSIGVRAAALFDVGTLPSLVAPGVSLTAVLELGLARFEAGGAYWFARRGAAEAIAPGVGVEVSMAAAQLRGCAVPLRTRVELGVCAGFEAGAQLGRGVGNSAPGEGAGPWVAALGGALLEWRVRPPLALHLGINGVFPLTAPAFSINDQVVYRASPVALRGALGVALHFR